MGSTMNRQAYENLIADDLAWLSKQPHSLEKMHIEDVLRCSPERVYGNGGQVHYHDAREMVVATMDLAPDCGERARASIDRYIGPVLAALRARCEAAEADAARMREALGELPKCADGTPVTPGMTVYWRSASPDTIDGVTVDGIYVGGATMIADGEEISIPLEWAYPTKEAALRPEAGAGAGGALPRWLDEAQSAEFAGDLLPVLRGFDDLFAAGRFAEADALFPLIPRTISSHLIVGILSATRPASEHLPSRPAFYAWAWERLGERAEKLIGRLRGREPLPAPPATEGHHGQ